MPEYRTPGVYIEEISAGPRPVAASSTTETGFVAIVTLPTSFFAGQGPAAGMFLPAAAEAPRLSWNRALAFRPLLAGPVAASDDKGAKGKGKGKDDASATPAPSGNRFQDLVNEILPGSWTIDAPAGDGKVTLRADSGDLLRFPVRPTMMNVKTDDKGAKAWDLSWGADDNQVLQLVSGFATDQNVKHSGSLAAVAEGKAPVTINIEEIQSSIQGSAPAVDSMDSYEIWRYDFGQRLFVEIWLQANKSTDEAKAEIAWETLSGDARKAWDGWLRSHPGIQRLELALNGFFGNGGKTAFVACAVQAESKAGPDKRKLLQDSFDGVGAVAMLAAPGLEFGWQQALLEYAGPAGRGDLFAVLEAPRYLLTRNPRGVKVNDFRWTEGDAPYEVGVLQTIPTPQATELRNPQFSKDEVLDRCVPRDDTGYGAAYAPWLVVENPLSTGPHDRYVIAPPAGHIAGVIAATDLKPGGGVWKAPANEQLLGAAELVTSVSDKEQGFLNMKGINIIRWRPGAGIRVWGARTIAADPLWTYINVRRLFLFVERSVRDAIQWAVFLPNTDSTRSDLRSTIAAFLYRLFMQGALDGATWQEAFSVRCDRDNNPDVDVRSGLLTVDVQMRPVYPAEFIRIRFSQSPMRSDVTEG